MRSRTLSLLAALAVLAGAAASVTAATPALASTPHNGLAAIWCASASSCIAVGISDPNSENPVSGHPLAETWNGKGWTAVPVRLPAGAQSGGLAAVSCVRPASCVAVGYWGKGFTGHELAESWNGKTWTPSEPPAATEGGQTELSGVSCPAAKTCVAVGQHEPNANTGLPVAVVEQWNGSKWTAPKLTLPGGLGFSFLTSVSCPSATQCVAVGAISTTTTASVLVESWNGKEWKRVSAPSPASTIEPVLAGVSCPTAVSCVAVGLKLTGNLSSAGSAGFAESWNGKAWALASVPWPKGSGDSELLGVSCPAVKSCLAVGGADVNTNNNAGVDNFGRAAAAAWNGKTWSVIAVPAPAKGKSSVFQGVSCPLAASCVAAGKAGPTGSAAGNGLSGFWNGKSWRLVTAI